MAIHTQDSSTAPVDANGVLSALIQQVSDGSPNYNMNGMSLTTKFKGPYAVLKDANQMVDNQLSAALLTIGVDTYTNFTFPAPPADMQWWVTSTSLEQTDAGSHGLLTVTCEARFEQEQQQGGQDDPYSDTWQLRWEAYTLKPFAFCANTGDADKSFTDPSVQEGQPIPGDASREHIEMFLNSNEKGTKDGHRWYRGGDGGGPWYLNTAEELVLNKVMEDKSALWHYPVLTHTTVTNYFASNVSSMISNRISYSETIGEKIDYIVGGSQSPSAAPNGCPYTFGDSWQWVKTGDDMQHVKTKGRVSFMRTETFMGVISADINYYGDVAFDHSNLSGCRWVPGKV